MALGSEVCNMVTHWEHEYDDVDEKENLSTNVLKEIEQTDSDAELMKIAKREWLMGNTLLAIKSAYKAAIHGNAKAQTFLGEAYELGAGVERDDAEAVKWYTKASMQMDQKALSLLAVYYYFGTVVEKDEALAEAMFLVTSQRKQSKHYLKKWYNVDIEKDSSFCYHNSLEEAYQRINRFVNGQC